MAKKLTPMTQEALKRQTQLFARQANTRAINSIRIKGGAATTKDYRKGKR